MARMIGAKEDQEITFTSGGTEANHLAIWSAVASYLDTASEAASSCPSSSRVCHQESSSLPHIVTSNIEHPAVSVPLREMVQRGWAKVTEVEVIPGTGRWTVEAVREAITVDTCLVTMMLANNESVSELPGMARCPTHLVPHSDVTPAEEQPRPNFDSRVARANGNGGLHLRKCLLMHARTLQQLTQVEPRGEV